MKDENSQKCWSIAKQDLKSLWKVKKSLLFFNNIITTTKKSKITIVPVNSLIEDVMAYPEKTT